MEKLEDPFDDWDYWGDSYDSHVLLYYGCDLTAAGILEPDIAPCLLCPPNTTDPALILTNETLSWGREVHYVCCGNCGTCGPWGDSESTALERWNAAHKRYSAEQ